MNTTNPNAAPAASQTSGRAKSGRSAKSAKGAKGAKSARSAKARDPDASPGASTRAACYFYNPDTLTLTPVPRVVHIGNAVVSNPSLDQCAELGGYPLDPSPVDPDVPEGKVAVFDGYELVVKPDTTHPVWVRKYRIEDAPMPTLADYDQAMENHLREEREARGYTTREPDAYLTSSVPRWSTDAMDWVAHRDDVMSYALGLINAVQSGERQPPTMVEFKAGLPRIVWSYDDSSSGE